MSPNILSTITILSIVLSLNFIPVIAQNQNERDFCLEPETPSQGRLLKIIGDCSVGSQDCGFLSDCLSENLVKTAEETATDCKKSTSQTDKAPFRACSVAATAYVILEQIRRVLVEETIYKECLQVKTLLREILKRCGGEEGEKILTSDDGKLNLDDSALQEILGAFLVGVGKRMQKFDVVRDDIESLERTKHMKALGAMIVSFALPGLFGLCEATHFRTGFILQVLALIIIGAYQFSRYGGYWAFVGVGSCLLVMIVELALLALIKKKIFGSDNRQEKKTE